MTSDLLKPPEEGCQPLLDMEEKLERLERRRHMLTPEDLAALRAEVSAGVVDGLKTLLSDEKAIKEFWRGGYTELSEHTSNGASQWVGKRVLTWFVTAIFTAAAVYLLTKGNSPGPKP